VDQVNSVLPALHSPAIVSDLNDLALMRYLENYFFIVTVTTECLAQRPYNAHKCRNIQQGEFRVKTQILGISGSPIKNSNTDRLVQAVLESCGLKSEAIDDVIPFQKSPIVPERRPNQ